MVKREHKFHLRVDKFTMRHDLDMLNNTQMEFLPAKTTPVIQPIDQGVFKNMHHRKELVEMTIAIIIEDSLVSLFSAATDLAQR